MEKKRAEQPEKKKGADGVPANGKKQKSGKPTKKKNRPYWILLIAAVLLIVAVILVLRVIDMEPEAFAARFKDSPAAIPAMAGLYLLKAATVVLLPQPLLYLLTGLLFSPLAAFLLTLAFLLLEFSLDYFIGRHFGKKLLDKLLGFLRGRNRTLDRLLDADALDRFGSIAALRLLPGISTDSVSLLAGAQEVKFTRYLLASYVGALPQAATPDSDGFGGARSAFSPVFDSNGGVRWGAVGDIPCLPPDLSSGRARIKTGTIRSGKNSGAGRRIRKRRAPKIDRPVGGMDAGKDGKFMRDARKEKRKHDHARQEHPLEAAGSFATYLRIGIIGLLVLLQLGLLWLISYFLRTNAAYLYIFFDVVALLTVVSLINRHDSSAYRIAWLIIVLAIPVFGLLLYFAWGRVDFNKKERGSDSKILYGGLRQSAAG